MHLAKLFALGAHSAIFGIANVSELEANVLNPGN